MITLTKYIREERGNTGGREYFFSNIKKHQIEANSKKELNGISNPTHT